MATTTSLLNGVTINEVHMLPSGAAQDITNNGVADSDDQYIELFNTGAGAVNLQGWQLWEGTIVKYTFKAGDIIPAGGTFTVVDVLPGGSTTVNVGGATAEADGSLTPGDFDVFALHNPSGDEYVILAGESATPGAIAAVVTSIEGLNVDAVQSGVTEVLPASVVGQSLHRFPDGDTNWVSGGPTAGELNCFADGTLIATRAGETAIEDLRIGDLVRTANGRHVPVRWVGRQTIIKGFARDRAQLVRIKAGALGNHSDLYVTGDHGMVVDGCIVNASALVSGADIDWVPLSETPERQTVYHVETEAHDIILANGAPSETYLDMPGRQAFDNFQEYLDLYGAEQPIVPNPRPRISSRRLFRPALHKKTAA